MKRQQRTRRLMLMLTALATVMIGTLGMAFAEGDQAEDAGLAKAESTTVNNGIPVIVFHIDESQGTIDAMNSSEDHSAKCYGTMDIVVPEGFKYAGIDASPETMMDVPLEYIKGRGNTTWGYAKKPYKIKLDKSKDVLGLGSNKHWVLLANVNDGTLMKNRFTAWLGEELGFAWTPQCVPVDVVMNDKYLGSYVLAEHIRIGKNRLNINELKETDTDPNTITGGYLIQGGQQTEEISANHFVTERSAEWANHTPSFDLNDDGYENNAQKTYIRGQIQDMEDALFGVDYTNSKGLRYSDYMDLESAAKYWLITQLCKNGDAYATGSTYFYKDQDVFNEDGTLKEMSKFYWGPLWDYDFAWGYATTPEDMNVEDFEYNDQWTPAMIYDEAFREQIDAAWPVLQAKLKEATADGGLMDQFYEETKASQAADYAAWKKIMKDEYSNYKDFKGNVDYLKQWTGARANWMDKRLAKLDKEVHKVTYRAEGLPDYLEYIPHEHFAKMEYIPEREGYVFLQWTQEDGSTIEEQMIKKDTVFAAEFIDEEKATKATDIYLQREHVWEPYSNGTYYTKYNLVPGNVQDQRIWWTSSDESIATVDKEGMVKFLKPGEVTITAKLSTGFSKSYILTIAESDDLPKLESFKLSASKLHIKKGEYAQLKGQILPEDAAVYIEYLSGNQEIVQTDNSGMIKGVRDGNVTVEVYANDDVSGITKIAYCKVIVGNGGKQIGKAVLSSKALTYNGKVRKPVAKTIGGKKLVKGIDYTIKYSPKAPKNVGRYTAIVTGIGAYKGTVKAAFKINPKGTRVTKLTKAKRAITVKWKKQSAKMSTARITGYQVQVATSRAFTKGKKTVSVKGYKHTKKTIKQLKAGKTYYVRVRTFMKTGGSTFYSKWSKVKKIKV